MEKNSSHYVTTLSGCLIRIPDIVYDLVLHNALRDVTVDSQTLQSLLDTLLPGDPGAVRHIINYLLQNNLTYLYGSAHSYTLRVRRCGRTSLLEYRMTKRIVAHRMSGTARGRPIHFSETEFPVDENGEYIL